MVLGLFGMSNSGVVFSVSNSINSMSRLAADCFAAAGRLQYTSFQTNSIDLPDALLVSIHDWKDAGSRELYIYDQVHMNGPPEMGRHFWGHLPLSWMHEPMLDFILYYILFSNEEARDDANPLSAAAPTSLDMTAVNNKHSFDVQTCRIKYLGI